MMRVPLKNGVRHLRCSLAFCIRWTLHLIGIVAVGAFALLGAVSGYVFVTQYGWIPFLVTTCLIALVLGILLVVGLLAIQVIEWAFDTPCG